MTIGDVLAFVAGIGAICVSTWALLVGLALLCGRQSQATQRILETHPWRALGSGVLLAIFVGGAALALANQPNGALKLVGWILLVALLALNALGGSGWVRLIAARINDAEPKMSLFGALLRGGALFVAAGLVPLVGWFFIVPLALATSIGGAWNVLRPRKKANRVLDSSPIATQHATAQHATAQPQNVHPASVQSVMSQPTDLQALCVQHATAQPANLPQTAQHTFSSATSEAKIEVLS